MRIQLELIGLRSSLAVKVIVDGLNAKTGHQAGCQASENVQDYTALHCESRLGLVVGRV